MQSQKLTNLTMQVSDVFGCIETRICYWAYCWRVGGRYFMPYVMTIDEYIQHVKRQLLDNQSDGLDIALNKAYERKANGEEFIVMF